MSIGPNGTTAAGMSTDNITPIDSFNNSQIGDHHSNITLREML